MPLFLRLFGGEDAEVSGALPTLVQLPLRHNGVDDAPPEAALPTGGSEFYGWPALTDHHDGSDWALLFSGWTTQQEAGAATLRASDELAALDIVLRVAGTASGF